MTQPSGTSPTKVNTPLFDALHQVLTNDVGYYGRFTDLSRAYSDSAGRMNDAIREMEDALEAIPVAYTGTAADELQDQVRKQMNNASDMYATLIAAGDTFVWNQFLHQLYDAYNAAEAAAAAQGSYTFAFPDWWRWVYPLPGGIQARVWKTDAELMAEMAPKTGPLLESYQDLARRFTDVTRPQWTAPQAV